VCEKLISGTSYKHGTFNLACPHGRSPADRSEVKRRRYGASETACMHVYPRRTLLIYSYSTSISTKYSHRRRPSSTKYTKPLVVKSKHQSSPSIASINRTQRTSPTTPLYLHHPQSRRPALFFRMPIPNARHPNASRSFLALLCGRGMLSPDGLKIEYLAPVAFGC
jgi:hypothetical protein